MQHRTSKRSELLEGAPLIYAPENELGVVFLFAHLAKQLRLKIEKIGAPFPDAIAYQKTDRGEKRIRIEFEYRSRNFRGKHSARKCDWIVCWEHNWPSVPKRLTVVELRRYFGLGFNVWIQPVASHYKEKLWQLRSDPDWSVPSRASKGDLLLFYHAGPPDKCIKQIFVLTGPVTHGKAGWRRGTDYSGPIRLVCRLKSPLFWEDFQNDRILSTAGFVRGLMRGRPNVTEYWPHLYHRITQRNPSVKRRLAKYAPGQF